MPMTASLSHPKPVHTTVGDVATVTVTNATGVKVGFDLRITGGESRRRRPGPMALFQSY